MAHPCVIAPDSLASCPCGILPLVCLSLATASLCRLLADTFMPPGSGMRPGDSSFHVFLKQLLSLLDAALAADGLLFGGRAFVGIGV